MRIGYYFLLINLISFLPGFSQQPEQLKSVPKKVRELEKKALPFQRVAPFSEALLAAGMDIPVEVKSDGFGLIPDLATLEMVAFRKPVRMDVALPTPDGKEILLRVYKVRIGSEAMQIRYADGKIQKEIEGTFYRGIIKDNPYSLVALSFYKDHVRGFVSTSDGNYVLGPLEDDDSRGTHIYYNDRTINHLNPSNCLTDESAVLPPDSHKGQGNVERLTSECVAMYWEVDHDIYEDKGNNTSNWMTGLINEVYTLYENDGITIEANDVLIWNVPSPYNGPSDLQFLEQFRNEYNGNFNGDIGHLINYKGSGGIAYLGGLCNPPSNVAFSTVSSSYQNVPTSSWTIFVCSHEIGHNLGSHHTHSCVWNGNNTRIDNCGGNAGYPSGNCNSNPPNPPNGGTIMSYCHLIAGIGVNFNEGFGPQPTEIILENVNSANCLIGCASAPPCAFQLFCPPNVTVECDANIHPSSIGEPFFIITGNCDNDPQITWQDDDSGLNGCNSTGTIIRIFTATEEGITVTCSQSIILEDTTAPEFYYFGNDVTINCYDEIPQPEYEAYDNCGTPSVEIDETILQGNCIFRYTLFRFFVATDDCGNSQSQIQSITVLDNSIPWFDSATVSSYSYGCDEIIPVIPPLVYDSCALVTLTYRDSILPVDQCPLLSFVRIWTATDQCGNTSRFNVLIEKSDTIPPVALCRSAQIQLLSDDNVVLDPEIINNGSTDDCTVLTMTAFPPYVTCEDLGELPVTLFVEDACGNRDSCLTTVSILADTAMAHFTVESNEPGSFHFDASGSAGQEFYWDFGDGQNGNDVIMDHVYLEGGTFQVQLIVEDTICSTRDTMAITVSYVISSLTQAPALQLKVYPNPGSGIFQIEYPEGAVTRMSLQVINLLGQTVYESISENSQNLSSISIDLSNKPDGVYMLRVQCDDQTISIPLILQR